MLFLSGSVVSIMTSTSGWASRSSTAPVWTRGGKMDGKMVPVTETPPSGAHISIVEKPVFLSVSQVRTKAHSKVSLSLLIILVIGELSKL